MHVTRRGIKDDACVAADLQGDVHPGAQNASGEGDLGGVHVNGASGVGLIGPARHKDYIGFRCHADTEHTQELEVDRGRRR